MSWEMPNARKGSPFTQGPENQRANREDRIDKALKEINKLSVRLQNLRRGPVSAGKDAQLRALEHGIQSKWNEVRALRAGAHPGPR